MNDFVLKKVLSPLDAWSFSFSCMIGWGAFMMPGTVFLADGGVGGSFLAFALACVAMIIIVLNYNYLLQSCPNVGGIFYLLQNTLNREHAFAASWATCFGFLMIIPLNARALSRLANACIYEIFQRELSSISPLLDMNAIDFVLMAAFLFLFGWICGKSFKLVARIQTVCALILFGGILALTVMVFVKGIPFQDRLQPLYYPGKSAGDSFKSIFILTPWAYVGVESVTQLSRENKFDKKRLGLIMIIAVLMGTFAYTANIFITLVGFPGRYADWTAYVDDLGSLKGFAAVAAVDAARNLFGSAGLALCLVTVLCAIITGMNGIYSTVSRLLFFMSRSNSLFPFIGKTDEKGVPKNAIRLVTAAAFMIILLAKDYDPIEQMASICMAFSYCYVSIAALVEARRRKNKLHLALGLIGYLVCLWWIVLLAAPITYSGSLFPPKTYAILAVWVFFGIWGYALTCRKKNTILD